MVQSYSQKLRDCFWSATLMAESARKALLDLEDHMPELAGHATAMIAL